MILFASVSLWSLYACPSLSFCLRSPERSEPLEMSSKVGGQSYHKFVKTTPNPNATKNSSGDCVVPPPLSPVSVGVALATPVPVPDAPSLTVGDAMLVADTIAELIMDADVSDDGRDVDGMLASVLVAVSATCRR